MQASLLLFINTGNIMLIINNAVMLIVLILLCIHVHDHTTPHKPNDIITTQYGGIRYII